MKINYNQVRGHHPWIKENMIDPDGKIYGCPNIYHQIMIDGVHVGDVFEGELKASAHDRKHKSNGSWWTAYKDGQIVGTFEKSRKKAIEKGLLI